MRPLTPRRPWAPLTDLQWHALLPYVLSRSPAGRRIPDLRQRMDAIFHLAHTPGDPWRTLPARYGKPDTISRFFRRLTHAGLWHRLLEALPDLAPNHPLRQIEYSICRATRRAARLGGLALNALIRRLDLRAALDGPPWLLPDPDLSETLFRARLPRPEHGLAQLLESVQTLRRLLTMARGRRSIPRFLREMWC